MRKQRPVYAHGVGSWITLGASLTTSLISSLVFATDDDEVAGTCCLSAFEWKASGGFEKMRMLIHQHFSTNNLSYLLLCNHCLQTFLWTDECCAVPHNINWLKPMFGFGAQHLFFWHVLVHDVLAPHGTDRVQQELNPYSSNSSVFLGFVRHDKFCTDRALHLLPWFQWKHLGKN